MNTLQGLVDFKDTFAGKFLATLVSFALVLSLCSITAFADDEQKPVSDDSAVEQPDLEPVKDESGNGATDAAQSDDVSGTVRGDGAQDAQEGGNAQVIPPTDEAPSPSDPASDDSSVAVDVAQVGIELAHSYIVYLDQEVKLPATKIEVPLARDFIFDVEADTGFEIVEVKAKHKETGAEIALETQEDGTYKVAASNVTSNLVIVPETAEVKVEGDEEPESAAATPLTRDTEIAIGDAERPSVEGDETAGDGSEPAADPVEPEANAVPTVLAQTVEGTTVTLTAAEGVLPKGATMVVEPVQSDLAEQAIVEAAAEQGREIVRAVVYDITLYDAGGSEIQPEGAVQIAFENAAIASADAAVYRIDDDEAAASLIAEGDTAETSHFSLYGYALTGAAAVAGDNKLSQTLYGTFELTIGQNYCFTDGSGSATPLSGSWTTEFGMYDSEGRFVFDIAELKIFAGRNGCQFAYADYFGEMVTALRYESFVGQLFVTFANGASKSVSDLNQLKIYFSKNASQGGQDLAIEGVDTLFVGEAATLSLKTPSSAYDEGAVVWTSSNPKVVALSDPAYGKVTGLALGTATITAELTGADGTTLTAKKVITVKDKDSSDLRYYKYSTESSNMELYYSINAGPLTQISLGDSFTADVNDAVVFFAKTKEGYQSGSDFEHRSSRAGFQNGGYTWGYYKDIDSPDIANLYLNGHDFTSLVSAAADIGIAKVFYYTDRKPEFTYREFKISAEPLAVTAAYDLDGGTLDGQKSWIDSTTYYHSNVVESPNHVIQLPANAPQKEGSTFSGWQLSVNNGIYGKIDSGSTAVSVDDVWSVIKELAGDATNYKLTFTALWEDKYAVTYDGNGATAGSVVDKGGPYKPESKVAIERNSFRKANATFIGWSTTPDGSGGTMYQPGEAFIITEDTTLYAQWLEKDMSSITYTVSPSKAGTVSSSSESLKPETGEAKGSTAAPNAGYEFVNWTDLSGFVVSTEETFVPEIPAGGWPQTTTYYANFTANTDTAYTVHVFYSKQDGTYADEPDRAVPLTGTTDAVATVEAADYAKTGFKLDASAPNNLTGVIAGDGSLVLKAHYYAQSAVRFDLNGGQGAAPEDRYVDRGTTISDLPTDDGFSNGDAVFKGWATTDGSESDELLDSIESVTINGDTVLYAIWADAYSLAYEVYSYPDQDNAITPAFVEAQPDGAPATVEVKAGAFSEDVSAAEVKRYAKLPETVSYPELGIEAQHPSDSMVDVEKVFYECSLDKAAKLITARYANQVLVNGLSDGTVSVRSAENQHEAALRQGRVTVRTHYVDASGADVEHAKLTGALSTVFAPAIVDANTAAGAATEELYFAWLQNDNKIDLAVTDTAADDAWVLNSVTCSKSYIRLDATTDGFNLVGVPGDTVVDIYLTPKYAVNYFEVADGAATPLAELTQTATLPVIGNDPSPLPSGVVATDALTVQPLPQKPGYAYAGWNTEQTMGGTAVAPASSILLTGIDRATLTLNLYASSELVRFQVNYEWTGLPNETVYDEAGNQFNPELPERITDLVINDPYAIDDSYTEGFTVYTHDEFGNQTGSYSFGGWNDPGNGVMKDKSITVSGTWTPRDIAVPVNDVTYDWGSENVPAGASVPAAITGLKPNQTYVVDTAYAAGYTVNAYDEYGNVTGVHTFSGWNDPGEGTMGTEPLIVTGSWSYEAREVAQYSVTYAWNLPSDKTYYDAEGAVLAAQPTLPEFIIGLVEGQDYDIDATHRPDESVVYVKDQYGNVNGSYTFKGWADPDNGKVSGTYDPIVVRGTWEYAAIDVAEFDVTYEWTGLPAADTKLYNADGSDALLALPAQIRGLVSGQPYAVDAAYAVGRTVYSHDEYGNVNGTYTFGGWMIGGAAVSGEQAMGVSSVAIEGTWEYSAQTVVSYPVVYAWDLPENIVFYDEAGNTVAPAVPRADPSELVPGQKFMVSEAYAQGYAVYTHDEYGNVNGSYTFEGWDKNGEQTMGTASVTITGTWTPASIGVTAYDVAYRWNGLSADAELFDADGAPVVPAYPATRSYVKGQSYPIDGVYVRGFEVYTHDEYGNVNGSYTFGGWTLDGVAVSGERVMGEASVTIEGEWSFSEKSVVSHSVFYQWNLPEGTAYYDIAGDAVVVAKPATMAGLVPGQPYTVDANYARGFSVYTHDEYGNVNGSYTFDGWTLDGEQVGGTGQKMGDADAVVSGAWTPERIHVDAFSVSYSWDLPSDSEFFAADGSVAAPVLPSAVEDLVKGQGYAVDDAYASGSMLYTHDEYGNVNGSYTFGGWTLDGVSVDGEQTMGTVSVVLEGSWKYAEQPVASHPVTYAWNLPVGVYYDGDGTAVGPTVPVADPLELVPGQKFTVSTDYAVGYTVYTHDAYGNVNGSYAFEGWDRAGEQTMGDAAVVIVGTWKHSDIEVDVNSVSYGWDLPENAVLFDADGNGVAPELPASLDGLVKGAPYTVDSTFYEGYKVYTHDAYGNVNGAYTFGGWTLDGVAVSGTKAMEDADVSLMGVWVHSDEAVATHSVSYTWDLPGNAMYYSAAGAVADTALPPALTELVSGQPYTIDTKYTQGITVYTHDTYGNVNGSYAFSGWNDPGSGIMEDADVTVSGSWAYEAVAVAANEVAYEWTGLPDSGSGLFDADGNAAVLTLPATKSYVKGQPYAVDTTYAAGFTVYSHDAYGNVNGSYTFGGWDLGGIQTMGDDDVAIRGAWEFAERAVEKHSVSYVWENLPADTTFYDAAGSEVGVVKPNAQTGLVPNQTYDIDAAFADGYAVYTHDAYGNVNGSYTFGGWLLDGEQVGGTTRTMGEADVTIEGSWMPRDIQVDAYSVVYDWGIDNVPDGVTLPVPRTGLVSGQPYAVDTVFAAGYAVNEYDSYNNVTGVYTFSGWSDPGNGVMGSETVTVTGSWSYAEQNVARYNVSYGWDLPENTYFDAAGVPVTPVVPVSLTGLVNGQPYVVDALFAQGTVLYTHDAYGNVNGSYTFGGWVDPNNGFMGEADVQVNGAWAFEAIEVPVPGPNPTPTPLPAPITPDTPLANVLPPAVTAPIDAAAQALQNVYETVIGEEPTPLTGPEEETIEDNETPLADGFDVHDPACWVHFYIILGMILSALYILVVIARRRRFIAALNGYENTLLGRDGGASGKGAAL
ncbi:SHIRT domain-containing protein [Raoultibacter phocaeensis]|uniref:SHIRT domain-containing protein n=1 Tax=Raoultibacter phocaeensis TaxID=2479841 RepID=UPI001118B712|nr:SHIRT domain-containing protein [Raoultibacter phocaeensis]